MSDEVAVLVLEHEHLARSLATKMARRLPPHADKDALRGAAYEGLIDAAVKWDPRRGPFGPYAVLRIRGSMIDEMRRSSGFNRTAPLQMSRLVDEHTMVEDGYQRIEDDAELVEVRHRLSGAVSKLPPRDRLIFTLHVFGGVSQESIGAALGWTGANVCHRVARSTAFVGAYLRHPVNHAMRT